VRSFTGLLCGMALIAPDLLQAAAPAKLPAVEIPSTFEQGSANLTSPKLSSPRWWEAFGDPALNALVERVLQANMTIAQAAARLNAARADARLEASSSAPHIGIEAGASQAGGPLINAAGGSGALFTVRTTLSWELDLSGRLADNKSAARLDARAAEALLHHTRLLIAVQTAQTYWRAQFLAAAADLGRQRIALGQRQLDHTKQREEHGLSPINAAIDAANALALDQAELVAIEREQAIARHRLAELAGSSTPIQIAPLAAADPPVIPPGLPSAMLARRPDVAAAEAEFLAADKRLSSARKSWLPSFSLTASGGAASPSLGQILSSTAQSFGLNLLLGLPLFDGGRHKALVGHRRAEVELAAARYGGCVLGALREVNDALAHSLAADRALDLATSRTLNEQREFAAGQSKAEHGLQAAEIADHQLDLLLEARTYQLTAKFDRLEATLEVIRSLGGGW